MTDAGPSGPSLQASSAARQRRWWLRWLGYGVAALVLSPPLALAGGYLWLRGSLPQTTGRIVVAGLAAPVDIVRDDHGVVTVRAAGEQDAYFGLGFAHAQDRLFQMEFTRRLGAGRLSEVVGEATVGLDRTMRVLGLYRLAGRNLAHLDGGTRAALKAYAAGVNAFLAQRRGVLPPEFELLRIAPEPWRPADSLVWGRLMALQLSGNWQEELLRLRLSRRLDSAHLEALWPARPYSAPGAVRSGRRLDAPAPGSQYAGLPPLASPWPTTLIAKPPGASNNWVVAGAMTASGRPLLANDPHLALQSPIQWYLARIELPDRTLAGATAPGVPFLLIGHNGHVAWGLTTTQSDTQDLFVEKLADGDPARYRTPDGIAAFETREEIIAVRGGADVRFTVRTSRHGPVVVDLDPGFAADEVLALAWPALRADDLTAQALHRMNRSRDAGQFRAALDDFHSPQQSILYADSAGRIGFMAPGRVPVRRTLYADGQMPAPGWSGEYDWVGLLPYRALPQATDPAAGWLATANSRIVQDGDPHFFAARWPGEERIRRIRELLDGATGLTADDMTAMQQDTLSIVARDLLPRLLAAAATEPDARRAPALAALHRWDFRMDRDEAAPLIFVAWLAALGRRVYGDELGDLYDDYAGWNPAQVASLLDASEVDWCDDLATPEAESCPLQILRALDDALAALAPAYGGDPAGWRWGEAHEARFAHPIFGRLPALGWLTDRRVATDGGDDTLNRGSWRRRETPLAFAHVHGPGLRAVIDFGDLDGARFSLAGGQSGNPLSPHYGDLIGRWRDGGFITIVGVGERVLTLQPGEAAQQ